MAVSDKNNEYIVKTLMWMLNSTHAGVNASYVSRPISTINYKYHLYHTEQNTTIPILGYFGLGLNGFYNVDDTNKSKPYHPKSSDLDLYEPIPIRCVPVDQDLSVAERAKYRIRVRKAIHGLDYYLYYLKVLTMLDVTVKLLKTDPVTGVVDEYIIDQSNLYPTPVKPTTSGTVSGTVTEVNVSFRISVDWVGSEVLEAINILYDGDMTYAKISEIGIYSGEDRVVQGYNADNAVISYTESIYTQLAYKICNIGAVITSPSYNGQRIYTLGDGNTLIL